jgi:hypothetical protein
MKQYYSDKPVHVRPYTRTRRGNLESVCEHWRSLPDYNRSLT